MLRNRIRTFVDRHAIVTWQPLFEQLLALALAGLNYGRAADLVATSGERVLLNYLARHVFSDLKPNVFDVGAAVGTYASAVLSAFGPANVQLHCFEPRPNALADLGKVLADADAKHANIWNIGLADRDGLDTLYVGLGSFIPARQPRSEFGNPHEISIRTLDSFCLEHHIDRVHLLKLDVEGSEIKVLQGARALIESDAIDLIQFECGYMGGVYFLDFFQFLQQRYRIYRIVQDGLFPVDRYNTKYDVCRTVNYLAVSRASSGSAALSAWSTR